MMNTLQISSAIQNVCPRLRLGCISSYVHVEESPHALQSEIEKALTEVRDTLDIQDVSSLPAIRDTKSAYRLLGKDPSRYRPSAEALLRRILNNKDLYRINNIIDALNLISIKYGFSIGGYDMNKIQGLITLEKGLHDDDYEGIGRGSLNIHDLPVFKDELGAFGSPTSDSQRTMITDNTQEYLMVIFDFNKSDLLETAMDESVNMITRYCQGTNISTSVISG